MVKQVKFMLYKSIGKFVLDLSDFELIVAKVVHLINKRPIGFKDGLRSSRIEDVPHAITPEMLILGHDTPTVSVIPQLHPKTADEDESPDYGRESGIKDEYEKLRSVREKLIETYHGEFLSTLMYQAVNEKNRYKPVAHQVLEPGDVVLIVESMRKRVNYPMGRVLTVTRNNLDEVTSAEILRGDTREKVRRHVSSLILIIPGNQILPTSSLDKSSSSNLSKPTRSHRPIRRAAVKCMKKLKSGI